MVEIKRANKGEIVQYKPNFIGMNYIEKPTGLFHYPLSANLLHAPHVRLELEKEIKEKYTEIQFKSFLEQRYLNGIDDLIDYYGEYVSLASKRYEYLLSEIQSAKYCINRYTISTYNLFRNREIPKYRLFVVDAFSVHHPKFKGIKCRYLKCLITNPLDETDMNSRWLQEKWVEPFNENGSYKEELYKKLQKKFGFKFKRSES